MPVIFTTPMSAFADYKQIWSQPNNAFSYLLNLKVDGRPAYQPHPSPPSYPLITVKRQDWSFAPQRNFGSQWWRHAGWPSVNKDVVKRDLGTVYQTRMPQAWDYHLQLDHYSTRPDGQAHFIQEFQQGFFPSASIPNTWIKAVYPGVYGTKLIRVLLEGRVADATEEEPADGYRVYRTTAAITVEGWIVDPDKLEIPAFWHEVDTVKVVDPLTLATIYSRVIDKGENDRDYEQNPIFDAATPMPVT